jgi:hypothetical protein
VIERKTNRISQIRNAIFVLFLCFGFYCLVYPHVNSKTFGSSDIEPSPTPVRRKGKRPARAAAKYSQFPHNIQAHRRECNSCHKFPSGNWKQVRKGDEAFPDITDYPKHESCLNCHRQQFFRGTPPVICSICHTNPSPNNSTRHPFPNPREIFDLSAKGRRAVSDFVISFPHDKHIDIVSQNGNRDSEIVNAAFTREKRWRGEESCSVCHQTYQPQGKSDDEYVMKPPAKLGEAFWLKKGTFKTVPISHAKCFTCHSTETGVLPAPTNCATCHSLKPAETKTDFDAKVAAGMSITDKIMLTAWRKRDSSATFRHEFSSHSELECTTCHNVQTMNTLNAQTKKVNVNSCSPCHITATSDDGGILNFEIDQKKTNTNFQCVKCHLSYGKSPVPESHVKAIVAQAGK